MESERQKNGTPEMRKRKETKIVLPARASSRFNRGEMASENPKRENLLVNLICNLVVPTLILTKFSGDKWLGPVWGLLVALAFPVGYGVWDFTQRRHANFISIIGFVSVLLSGSLGLMKIGGLGFAIKDGAVPCVIGLAVLLSLKTKRPLVRSFLYNDQIIDVPRVDRVLTERNAHPAFERLLVLASFALAFSFLMSGVLNFGLARYLLKSPPGTPEFNAELGRMHFWNLPIILVPSMIMMMLTLWWLLGGIRRLTGLKLDEIFPEAAEKDKEAPAR
jgi:hypothetical protein